MLLLLLNIVAHRRVARHQAARQWTDWELVFSAQFSPLAAHAAIGTAMSGVFYAVRAEGHKGDKV
jgi:hypothetical protein